MNQSKRIHSVFYKNREYLYRYINGVILNNSGALPDRSYSVPLASDLVQIP